MEIDLAPIRRLRAEMRKTSNGVRITLFHVILAAWVRTIAMRPQFNRFISGQRVYQRNRIQFSFVVKSGNRDEASRESAVKLDFSPFDTLQEVAEKVAQGVGRGRVAGTGSDVLANILAVLPRFAINAVMGLFRFLDYYNLAPWFLVKDDPLYSSVFFANLGSIGMNAPHHHLFEWGNTSLFVVIGEPERKIVPSASDTIEIKTILPIKTSIDDRISEGMYCAQGSRLFQRYCEHPEELLERAVIPPEIREELALLDESAN